MIVVFNFVRCNLSVALRWKYLLTEVHTMSGSQLNAASKNTVSQSVVYSSSQFSCVPVIESSENKHQLQEECNKLSPIRNETIEADHLQKSR